MRTRHLLFFFLFFCLIPLSSEQMFSPDWGYTLDLPEGFVMTSNQENTRYQFDHSMLPVTLLIASYPLERYETAEASLESVYTGLQLKGEIETLKWRGNDSAIGLFTIENGSNVFSGWAISVLLPENKGTTVFLGYAPIDENPFYGQVIASALDSVDFSRGTVIDTGIITKYAYPSEGDKNIVLEIAGKKINTVIDKSDIPASEFVLQREYALLAFFAETPLWKEAWQRFYRMLYRDSHKRLQKVAFSIYNSLSKSIREENPEDFDRALAQTMLTWVQGFEYLRIPLGTDFMPLPAVISGSGSDCDSRALLLSVLMSHMRYDTMLFVSREFSHALFGIAIEGAGARLEANGQSYLLGETTAPVSIGMVAQEMSEITKWIAIDGL